MENEQKDFHTDAQSGNDGEFRELSGFAPGDIVAEAGHETSGNQYKVLGGHKGKLVVRLFKDSTVDNSTEKFVYDNFEGAGYVKVGHEDLSPDDSEKYKKWTGKSN